MTMQRSDLGRITLSVLFIGGLIAGSLWILLPFLPAFVWATMIVVATWPLMRRLEGVFGGRRAPAIALMTLGLLAVLIVPLGVALHSILGHTGDFVALIERLPNAQLPAAPEWIGKVPLAGERAQAAWNKLASSRMADLMVTAQPYVRSAATWFAQQAGSFALVILQFVLIVAVSAVLYAGGESWSRWVRRFAQHLAGEQGDRMVVLASQAIRGVALGVVVTALVQSALGGIGLAIAGVPFAGVLTAVMFALCIAQLGPSLVMFPATAWVFWSGDTGWGTFLLVWSLIVSFMDNVLRPYLIKQGADLPLMLIFAGVVGGLLSFGLLGLFVGPVLLAVGYTLLDAWVKDSSAQ